VSKLLQLQEIFVSTECSDVVNWYGAMYCKLCTLPRKMYGIRSSGFCVFYVDSCDRAPSYYIPQLHFAHVCDLTLYLHILAVFAPG
jgi:hypothetical protein